MIDYKLVAKCIAIKTHCSASEAWDGLSTAFIKLDRTRSEREQCRFLIVSGAWSVYTELRHRYGGGQFQCSLDDAPEVASGSIDIDEWDFLNAFPEGLVKQVAKAISLGQCSYTYESVRHWLRKTQNINSRTITRKVLYEVGIYSKRV